LAQGAEIEIEERELLIKDVLEADEIFLTNAIMGLMPVCRLEKHTIGNEKPGPVYQKLHDAYRQTIERETNEN
ncbi:MAG: aminotransferase class IV, partial [Planctomycetes bacterium]|nr:aminotransferase class IV [Planctomycetota bacterium]